MRRQLFTSNNFKRIIILSLTLISLNSQNCFYSRNYLNKVENFDIFTGSTTPASYSSSGYTFPVTWSSNQTSFTNYSFYLVGFKLQSAGKVLTYEAKILNISSTGATFYFKFFSHSQIVYGQFGIIMLKPCSRMLRLIHFCRFIITKNFIQQF